MVPAKTQSEQGSRRRRFGSGLETLNDGGCSPESETMIETRQRFNGEWLQ